jgi:tetratricopeptide (TPR) repeat protein
VEAMSNLDRFLRSDDMARDRVAKLGALLGFGCFLFAKFMGTSNEIASLFTFVVMGCAYLWQLRSYCYAHSVSAGEAKESVRFRRRFAMATATVTIIAGLRWIPEPKVEAAILDRRFRNLTRDPRLSPREAEEVKDNLQIARERGVTLPSTTQKLISDAVKTSALQEPRPPFTDAATAFIRYTREVPVPKSIPGPTEAEVAMDAAMRYVVPLLRAFIRKSPLAVPERAAVEMAISLLTRAIELAGSNANLKSDALLSRAYFYTLLSKSDEALADADASEKFGVVDIPSVISVEADALVDRGMAQGRPEDLKRAVELLTLEVQLPPPLLIADQPQFNVLYLIDAFTERARAYYGLKQYSAAIEDSKRFLNLLPQASELSEDGVQTYLQRAYLLIVGAYLHLGDVAEALDTASEWERKSNAQPIAVSLRQRIESQFSDAQVVLSDIEKFIYHP